MQTAPPGSCRSSTVIIAKPGYLRDSLQVVMQATNRIDFVGLADDWDTGLRMAADLVPNLVVIDPSGMTDQIGWQMLSQLKMESPEISWCVLAQTVEQEAQARSAGAETIMPVGLSTQTVFTFVDKLNRKKAERHWPALLEGGLPTLVSDQLLE